MPAYDVVCAVDGESETYAAISEVFARGDAALACPTCGGSVTQVIRERQRARIDDAESIGSDRADSTRGVNLGLPGRDVDLGAGRKGYRPVYSNEIPTNRSQREYAKRNGLTPADGGRYKTSA